VAIVLVEYADGERFSGTAFAFDSLGTMITNKHILIGEDGTKTPRRLGVIFSGSTQFWRGELVGVSPDADVGVFRVTINGGTPRVVGLTRTREVGGGGSSAAIRSQSSAIRWGSICRWNRGRTTDRRADAHRGHGEQGADGGDPSGRVRRAGVVGESDLRSRRESDRDAVRR